MLRGLVAASVRFRLLVVPVAAVLTILGAVNLHETKVDVLPELGPPTVEVQTESLGLSTAEVESLITVPMENFLLSGIKGVRTLRSDSVPGVSRIDLIFPRGTNLLDARALVQEQLTRIAALPNVAAPPQMLQPVSTTPRVMMVGLSSPRLSLVDLSILARWTIVPKLLSVPGVANVAIWGQRDRQIQVRVDPNRLRAAKLTLDQIVSTAGNAQLVSPLTYLHASTPGASGFIDGPNQRLSIRHQLPLSKPVDLAQVPVEQTKGVKLGQVTHVVQGHQPLIGDAVVNGGQGLLLAIDKRPGASTIQVTNAVKTALAELRAGLRGVVVDPKVFQPASFIHSAIHDLTVLALIALALVIVALAAFFLEWRALAIAVITIPLSLLAALWALDALGYSANALVTAGLLMSVGVVVDHAIAASERMGRVVRERRAAGSEQSTAATILDASYLVRTPVAYATLIAVVTVLPVIVATGLAATFLHPLVFAYALAVVASMVVSLTLTPALGVLLFARPPRARRRDGVGARLRGGYAALMQRTIRTSPRILLAAGAIGLAGLVLIPFLEEPDRPSFHDRNVLVRWDGTPSISLPEMDRITRRATGELRAIPGIRSVSADVGRAVSSDRLVATNSSEIWLRIANDADYGKTLGRVHQVVDGTPGLDANVTSYEDARSAGVLEGPSSDLNVRVYGHDYPVLKREADRVAAVVHRVGGVTGTTLRGLPITQPTLLMRVNLEAAQRHGVKPGDVRRALATLTSGLTVGNFFEQQKVFDVVVRGIPATSRSADSVRNLLVDTPSGGTVPVRDIASIRIAPDPLDIRHDATERYVDLHVDTNGDVSSVKSALQDRIRKMPFPLEYHAEVLNGIQADASGGEAGGISHGQFVIYVIAAELAILLLLQAAFASWQLAFVVFLTLPLATIGGLVAALLGEDLNQVGSMAGLLAVIGLVVRPAIGLVTRIQDAQREPGAVPGADLTMSVALDRFGATAMASVATALIMLPFALWGTAAGNEITQPMAVVILAGLVTATIVNLLVVPAICLAFGAAIPAGEEPLTATDERRPEARPPVGAGREA